MGRLRLAEASALDFTETLDDRGQPTAGMRRRLFGRYARMVFGGTGIAIRTADGRLCLVAGLYPEAAGYLEAWFAAGPALRSNLLPAMRLCRRMLVMAAGNAAPVEVRCYLAPESVAAPRLAAWFGFINGGAEVTPLGSLSVWKRDFP